MYSWLETEWVAPWYTLFAKGVRLATFYETTFDEFKYFQTHNTADMDGLYIPLP
jgi:hypothetical protein